MLDIRPQLKKKESIFIKYNDNLILMNPRTKHTVVYTPEGKSEVLATDSRMLTDALLGGRLTTKAEWYKYEKKSYAYNMEHRTLIEPFHPDDLKD